MKFGIIGTTPHAAAVARALAKSGGQVSVSDPADRDRAERLASELGVKASQPYNQAVGSDVLVMAMPWLQLEETLRQLGPLTDEVVVDAIIPEPPHAASGAEELAQKLDNRHIVEAFVESNLEPGSTIALCSDDPDARRLIAEVIRECGCTPRDLGPLSNAARMERGSTA